MLIRVDSAEEGLVKMEEIPEEVNQNRVLREKGIGKLREVKVLGYV